ncbi:MAG: 3-hydroxyacyl-CoA dehydrogenase NAD-binding domain-containing protein [Rhodospirillaceae bacterium]|nr:3-hydroxyacyl-CoA dehydrogenase NAD-binding domain-containing protein [Rhodospirillaceae bacterium]
MTNLLKKTASNGVVTLTINNPPVNALSFVVRQALLDAVNDAEADSNVRAIVIGSTGRLFSGGADIREFDAPIIEPGLPGLIDRIEACTKPVVIALFGTTLGGGFELAMGCHYRIASPGSFVGLPEVHLGLIPGAGGTQRLPRLIGAEAAIEAITTGRHIPGEEAVALGALDKIADGDIIAAAQAAAVRMSQGGERLPRTCDRTVDVASVTEGLFDSAKAKLSKRRRGFEAPPAAVNAISWSVTESCPEGLTKERTLSAKLKASIQSKAQRHLFFAERMALKIPDIPRNTPLRDVRSAGVIGAGTMGIGITLSLLRAGIPVTLVETEQDALERGFGRLRKTLDRDVERGRLSAEKRDERIESLSGGLKLEALSGADFVIEAAFESLELKKDIFSKLDKITRDTAILASNTSTLDLDDIAQSTSRPERVIGTHFFSPANIMRLLEVVRGERTAKDVVATTMSLGKRIGKVPALSGVGYGFIGNRMLEDYVRESQMLLLEGATPAQVDGVLEKWGMAMGPCAVMDLAGQDVSFLTRDQNRHLLPDDPRYCVPGDLMNALGWFGQKTRRGFYQYPDGRTRKNDPEVVTLIKKAAMDLGVRQRNDISDEEIFSRCIHALVNRGAQLLDDGIALRASDIDVIWSAGYGFPAYRGGPMFFGSTIGLSAAVDAFKDHEKNLSNDFGYWTPAPLLVKLASENKTFADFDADRRGGA